MRKFLWSKVWHPTGAWTSSLLEVLPDNKALFWASISKDNPDMLVCYSKDRVLQTIEAEEGDEKLSIQDAQLIIEKHLMDMDVIKDGDVVEYRD